VCKSRRKEKKETLIERHRSRGLKVVVITVEGNTLTGGPLGPMMDSPGSPGAP
jgi:hypothetical protein